jgi:predicted lipoprotein with Yx(FWY)xxD motif
MRNRIFFIIFIIAAVILIAGCSQLPEWAQIPQQTINKTDTVQQSETIMIANTQIGEVLVDANGMTLYYFSNDFPGGSGISNCTDECSVTWPSFDVDKVIVSHPLDSYEFSTIMRSDGKKQITYWGLPLYYYVEDTKPGEMKGQSVDKFWHVATPAGTLVFHSRPGKWGL